METLIKVIFVDTGDKSLIQLIYEKLLEQKAKQMKQEIEIKEPTSIEIADEVSNRENYRRFTESKVK